MAESVYQQMSESGKELLADKLATNPDLCNVVLALLSRLIVMADMERKTPMEGIRMAPPTNSVLGNGDCVIRSQVTFGGMAVSRPAMWPPQSDFAVYVRSRAHGLGLAMQRNPKLCEFFQSMVEALDQYCLDKGLQFGALIVKKKIISVPGDVLVLQVGRKLLDD